MPHALAQICHRLGPQAVQPWKSRGVELPVLTLALASLLETSLAQSLWSVHVATPAGRGRVSDISVEHIRYGTFLDNFITVFLNMYFNI